MRNQQKLMFVLFPLPILSNKRVHALQFYKPYILLEFIDNISKINKNNSTNSIYKAIDK